MAHTWLGGLRRRVGARVIDSGMGELPLLLAVVVAAVEAAIQYAKQFLACAWPAQAKAKAQVWSLRCCPRCAPWTACESQAH